MKNKKRLVIFLICFVFVSSVTAQVKFEDFFIKFKRAVKAKDETAVAALTRFPLSMPYGMGGVKNKTQFASRYNTIFDGEADAAKCFESEKPARETASRYDISCGFKTDASGDAGKPIVYSFEKTRIGWRFVGLDNINE